MKNNELVDNMSTSREIIRMIVLEEHADEFEEIKKENEEIKKETEKIKKEIEEKKAKLKLLKQCDLPPEAEQIIDHLLEI